MSTSRATCRRILSEPSLIATALARSDPAVDRRERLRASRADFAAAASPSRVRVASQRNARHRKHNGLLKIALNQLRTTIDTCKIVHCMFVP